MPPALHVTRAYLLSIDAVTDEVAERIHTRLPKSKVFPLIILRSGPGGRRTVRDRVARTPIDVHVYPDPTSGTPDRDANLLADLVHGVLLDAAGYVDEGNAAVLLACEEITAPYPAPDDTDDRDVPLARWQSAIAVHVRPNP